jgi:hypothetical protein
MPMMKVLLNERGKVAGTARLDVAPSGAGAPQSATLVARAGERAVEVEVDELTISIDPEELHGAVAKLAKPPRARTTTRKTTRAKRRK